MTAHDPDNLTAEMPAMGARDASTGPVSKLVQIAPIFLAYLIGPVAFFAVLILMDFGAIVREPMWLWVVVFIGSPLCSFSADTVAKYHPSLATLHLRIAMHSTTVIAVIYLTGWGPVLWGAFAFVALDNISRDGSRAWGITVLWSMVGIGCGQVMIALGWMPSRLTLAEGNAVAAMGFFVLTFVIWMAGATMRKKEEAERQMILSEDRFRSLIQNSSDVTMVMDPLGACTFVSPASASMFGVEPEEFVGKIATDFVHPDDVERVALHLTEVLSTHVVSPLLQFRMQRADGTWCDVEAVVSNLVDRPSVSGYVAHLRDVTERKEFEAILAHRALHDSLTGLANRQLVLDRAEQMISRSLRSFDPIAAFFIDLDNFKDANDSLGHEAGDRLLQSVATRLESILRESDTVGRIGGDEFVILTEGLSLRAGPDALVERIHAVLREPFIIDGFEGIRVNVTASIGVAMGIRTSAQELLRDADIALYRAKAAGRDQAIVFDPSMQVAVASRLELRSDIDSALERNEYFLLYQPVVELDSTRIRGVEALLRWRHPVRGVISPDDFVPLLEDCGLIVDVGRWVLETACEQAGRWRKMGHDLSVSVNVSMRQLESPGFVKDVERAMLSADIEPHTLVLEVTETALMKDPEGTVARLGDLKRLGVRVAIDDFGTGYSSLAYLRQFPVDVLKIDRSFVSSMDGSENSTALVRTMVELGRALGLIALAEGIEDDQQLAQLRALGCSVGQGYLFSKPVSPAVIEVLLGNDERRLGHRRFAALPAV